MSATTRGAAASIALGALVAAAPALADRISHPTAVFEGLDKITGRIISFEAGIDETVQFGTLLVTPRVCYTRPPTEAPRTDGFVEVDEATQKKTYARIFTGWMFAASPGLHGVENPVYDIWLTDCKGGTKIEATPPEQAELPDSDLPDLSPQNPQASPADAKPAPTPKKRRAPKPAEAAQAPAGFDAATILPPTSRGGVRRYVPIDSAPIPPGNVGQ